MYHINDTDRFDATEELYVIRTSLNVTRGGRNLELAGVMLLQFRLTFAAHLRGLEGCRNVRCRQGCEQVAGRRRKKQA